MEHAMGQKLYVECIKGGGWALTKEGENNRPEVVFKSKVDAVLSAWSKVTPTNVVVRNANGQVLQSQKVNTSKPEPVMRSAVLHVGQGRAPGKISERKK
jgi:hypothetical protein